MNHTHFYWACLKFLRSDIKALCSGRIACLSFITAGGVSISWLTISSLSPPSFLLSSFFIKHCYFLFFWSLGEYMYVPHQLGKWTCVKKAMALVSSDCIFSVLVTVSEDPWTSSVISALWHFYRLPRTSDALPLFELGSPFNFVSQVV